MSRHKFSSSNRKFIDVNPELSERNHQVNNVPKPCKREDSMNYKSKKEIISKVSSKTELPELHANINKNRSKNN